MSKESILSELEKNIAVDKFKNKLKKEEKIKSTIGTALSLSICLFSITGIVFAKEISTKIYENFWLTGNGVGKAMEEGYIETPKTDYSVSNTTGNNEKTGKIVEDTETKIKVSEFVMDDFTLSINFEVELSDSALDVIEAKSSKEMYELGFPDIVISDENNYVLFGLDQNSVNEFFKNRNLDIKATDYDSKYLINSGINAFLGEREGNNLKVTYNIYTDSDNFPKSKKLNISFKEINVSKEDEGSPFFRDGEVTLKGDWNMSIDVPEKMYNRTSIVYTQKSTTNKNYKAKSAVLYNTGMEISFEVKVDKPKAQPKSKKILFYESLPKDSELINIDIFNYIWDEFANTPEYKEYIESKKGQFDFSAYLENKNGERFEFTNGPRENGSASISDDGILTYKAMYDLTKYNQTDEVIAYITYRGNNEKIVLKKKEV